MFNRLYSPSVILALSLGFATSSAMAEDASKSVAPLSADVVTAWTKAGAEVGWTKYGFVDFRSGDVGIKGEVPAFSFSVWTDGFVGKLPQPQRAFGLSLFGTKITDAGLKDLAELKELRVLDLGFTKVTDTGLKELAGLRGLQFLNLADTKVTDAGLKVLGELKDLQVLLLERTNVTDMGLKDLAGLK